MGKGGGSGGGGGPTGPSNPNMDAFIGQVKTATKPILDAISSQILEAITTGGVGARIPVAQQGVEATRAATSASLTSAGEDLARSGLADSPFGKMILNMMNQSGNIAVEQAGMQPAMDLFSVAPSFALGTTGQIMSGLGQSAALGQSGANLSALLANRSSIANNQLLGSILSPFIGAAGRAGGTALGGLLGGGGGMAAADMGGVGLGAAGDIWGAAAGGAAAAGAADVAGMSFADALAAGLIAL